MKEGFYFFEILILILFYFRIKNMVLFHADFKNDNTFDINNDMNTITTNCSEFQRKKPRLVQKCGELNINANKVPKRKRRLLSDLFNTILDIKWRWHVIFFLLSFIISWFFFASIWYIIALIHNDIDDSGLYNQNFNNTVDKIRCVSGVHDFTSALLYSIETQHTIGMYEIHQI